MYMNIQFVSITDMYYIVRMLMVSEIWYIFVFVPYILFEVDTWIHTSNCVTAGYIADANESKSPPI